MAVIEDWKTIAGFEGFYEISSLGQVRSLDRLVNSSRRKGLQKAKGKLLKAQPRPHGHLDILLKKNGMEKRFWIHRLVAEAFIPNPNNLPIVNHVDNNPANNSMDNLEWCTQKHNIRHCVFSGRFKARKGVQHKDCKLKEEDVLEIRLLGDLGETYSSIGRRFGISPSHAKNIIKRKKWKHL